MTMTPRSASTGSFASIAAAARRSTLKVPMRLMVMTSANCSSGNGPRLPTTRPGVPTPAQLTTIRSVPSSRATSIAAWTCASSRTSVATNRARSPSSLASDSPGEDGRSRMTTAAPSACRRRTVASPTPLAPPVTRATVESVICMASVSPGGVLEELAADDEPLDLVGALEDLGHLGLAHVALQREVLGVARATEHLHRVGGDAHGVVGADQLGHGRFLGEGSAGIVQPGGVEVGRAGRRHAGLHVGEQEGEPLVVADRSPELLALLGVGDGLVERRLCQTR